MKRSRAVVGGLIGIMWLLCGVASAQVVTEFSAGITGIPTYITSGPDGNLWFTEGGTPLKIGRITPTGTVTEFSAGPSASIPSQVLLGITAGPDGNLWFAEYNQGTNTGGIIGRITKAGVVTEFPIPGVLLTPTPWAIAAGPDGNLWFTDAHDVMVGRITTAGAITMFPANPGFAFAGIAAGADGNLWFPDAGNAIDRITTAGVVAQFSAGVSSTGYGITAGPDGNLWFAEFTGNKIGRITTAGTVTEFSSGLTGSPGPREIASGPDANLWFTEYNASRVGRITPTGTITEFSTGISPGALPYGITAGPDGNLWFAESGLGRIGRITTGGGGGPSPTSTAAASSLNPSTLGQTVTFTATVTGNSPTGTVQFKDGASNLGSPVALSGGTASLATSGLAQGAHSITAVYGGDAGNAASTSPILTQTVDAAVGPPPPVSGQPIPTLSEWSVFALACLLAMLGQASIGKADRPENRKSRR